MSASDDDEGVPFTEALLEVLERSRELGFLGPGPVEEHAEHALRFAAALEALTASEAPARGLDLGTGGGVPGLVLARYWQDSQWTLLDSMERRTSVLRDEVAALGWSDRVAIVCARAEDAARDPHLRASFDLVTARSFAAPGVTAECGRGFLVPGGHFVISDPPEGPGQRWPTAPLADLGLEVLGHVHGCTVLRATGQPDEDVPRAVGKPAKRPRF